MKQVLIKLNTWLTQSIMNCEDLAESIFNVIFKNKLVKKISLKLEKLDILKKTKSVGIEISKSKI